jgi:SAM-dependent methyltransferase
VILPPGTILQQMYFKERLRELPCGSFVEVGAGQGILSNTLLDLGWKGSAYELNPQSVAIAAKLNRAALSDGRFRLFEGDWLDSDPVENLDLIVSSMVLEHLDDVDESRYFDRCRDLLKPAGAGILLVPSCPDYWGTEDEIAGHYRRYTFDRLRHCIETRGLQVRHLAGLTYPISNILYPVSEYLVGRAERGKLDLPLKDRTRQSGNRSVLFKTTFPGILRIVLNEAVMYPFHLLQKINAGNARSMVIYAEFSLPP